jgi:hypothetical protein
MRSTHKLRELASVGAVLLCLLSQLHAQNGEGDAWVEMNSDMQTGFVWGYTIGLSRGFAQGCVAYGKLAPSQPPHRLADDLFHKCLRQGYGFSKLISFYVEQITEFYKSSAEDRKVPIDEVLRKLSDDQSMTPKQMHEWFKQHGYGRFRH